MSDPGVPTAPFADSGSAQPRSEELTQSPRPGAVRRDVLLAVALAASGLFVGAAWRLLAEFAAKRAEELEAPAAVDLTLAMLNVALGVGVAVVLIMRPGPDPVRRFLLAIAGLVIEGAVAWGVGVLLGVAHLGAVGAAFLAAPTAALIVFGSTFVGYLRNPEG